MRNDVDQPKPMAFTEPNDFIRAFIPCCSHRTIFITERGLLGVGPRATQPGDKVAIIAGGSMPFVVRATNVVSIREDIVDMDNPGVYIESPSLHRHTCVGPSYIHHFMNGEGVIQVKPEMFQWQMIDFM